MRFKWLAGDINWKDYGGKWVSKKFNDGDFDYWLVLELINLRDISDDAHNTYAVSISAVSPEAAGQDKISECARSYGCEADGIRTMLAVEILHGCGVCATLYSDDGNNCNALLKAARKKSDLIQSMFGFYMDKQMNRIGNDGWDFISGNIGWRH